MSYLDENKIRSRELETLIKNNGFDREVTEFAIGIIDLTEQESKIFGMNLDHFMYPASVYKIFIGAEVLRQVEIGKYRLDEQIIVKSPNDVDKDTRLFPDGRPLLKAGDSVTVDYLLELMLGMSDNTASNCLIDLVGRENISKHIIEANGWQGSEVTREFLDRVKENKPYQYVGSTQTCARHVVEFFYLVEKEKLISSFVSQKLKEYMSKYDRTPKHGYTIPDFLQYRKGGYLETNLYISFYRKSGFGFDMVRGLGSLIKTILTKGWAFLRYMHDAGVVKGNYSHYVVVVFTLSKQLNPRRYFNMNRLAKTIFDYMESSLKK